MSKQLKPSNPWDKAKWFHILNYEIPVVKGTQPGGRRFYTELHKSDGTYLASMGSSMPTYLLAALETYFKRGELKAQLGER